MKVKAKMTYASAKEELPSVKEALEVAKNELKDFQKANKIKGDAEPTDKKVAKQLAILRESVQKKQDRKTKLIEFLKSNKPAPEPRESKYNYPPEVKTSLDKKKFRATMRANAKRAKVDLDTYLANPAKYAKIIAEAVKAKAAKGEKKKKKKVKTEEAAPAKKLKMKPEGTPKKKLKKKIAPPPIPEVENTEEESEEGED